MQDKGVQAEPLLTSENPGFSSERLERSRGLRSEGLEHGEGLRCEGLGFRKGLSLEPELTHEGSPSEHCEVDLSPPADPGPSPHVNHPCEGDQQLRALTASPSLKQILRRFARALPSEGADAMRCHAHRRRCSDSDGEQSLGFRVGLGKGRGLKPANQPNQTPVFVPRLGVWGAQHSPEEDLLNGPPKLPVEASVQACLGPVEGASRESEPTQTARLEVSTRQAGPERFRLDADDSDEDSGLESNLDEGSSGCSGFSACGPSERARQSTTAVSACAKPEGQHLLRSFGSVVEKDPTVRGSSVGFRVECQPRQVTAASAPPVASCVGDKRNPPGGSQGRLQQQRPGNPACFL